MSSKFSVFAVSWRQTIPGTTLFKHPLKLEHSYTIVLQVIHAIDAAVATAAALGVAVPFSSGIGGGGFMVIYLKDRDRMAPGH
jgi:gamma-glutamyltranspeptidase/glutathione hydrolase